MRTKSWIGVMVCVGLAGVVHGYWTNRWSGFRAGEFDRELLASTPPVLGDWEGGRVTPQEGNEFRPYSASRHYVNRVLDRQVVVSLIAGIPGKVATHTPDVCYPGSGYTMKTDITRHAIDLPGGGSFEYFSAEFEKSTSSGKDRVRVRWSWTDDGTWHAPDYPRWYYARSPVLHKLYVVHPVSEAGTPEEDPAYLEFIAALATEIGQRLKRGE